MPIQEIAKQIDKLQPDVLDLWELLKNHNTNEILDILIAKSDDVVTLFKLELFTIYVTTHADKYFPTHYADKYKTVLEKHNIDAAPLISAGYTHTNVSNAYIAYKERTNKGILIIDNVANPKQYLNYYLKRKLYPTTTAFNKNLKPDKMSLVIFKQWLKNIKPLNSVQAEEFLKKVQKFDEPIKEEYFYLIMDHTSKPSINLQRYLEDNFNMYSKYIVLNRRNIRLCSNSKLTFREVYDKRDSTYRPFATDIIHTYNINKSEFESLIGTVLIYAQETKLSVAQQHMYDSLISALRNTPDFLPKYINDLQTAQSAITKLLKDLNG